MWEILLTYFFFFDIVVVTSFHYLYTMHTFNETLLMDAPLLIQYTPPPISVHTLHQTYAIYFAIPSFATQFIRFHFELLI